MACRPTAEATTLRSKAIVSRYRGSLVAAPFEWGAGMDVKALDATSAAISRVCTTLRSTTMIFTRRFLTRRTSPRRAPGCSKPDAPFFPGVRLFDPIGNAPGGLDRHLDVRRRDVEPRRSIKPHALDDSPRSRCSAQCLLPETCCWLALFCARAAPILGAGYVQQR
jgi:hypothetical protein